MDIFSEVSDGLEQYFSRKADAMKIPLVATFELSPICNLNCEMCYIRQKVQEVKAQGGLLGKEFWIEKARETIENGTLFVLLTGGEPFLYPEFKELYIALHSMGIFLTVNTNATLIGEEEVEWLKKYPPRRLNVSLYGASDETYRVLCKDPQGFTKTKNAIELLRQNNIMMRISYVRTVQNIDDYEDVIRFCNQNHLPLSVSNYMFPPIRKYCQSLNNVGRLDAETAGKCAFQYAKDKRNKEQFEEFLRNAQTGDKKKVVEELEVVCRAGTSSFWINWKGEMLPCGMMVTPKIDIKRCKFVEAWEFIKAEVEQIRLSSTCARCEKRENCMICAAAAYAETGGFHGTPEYLCQMTEAFYGELSCEIVRRNQ